MTMSSMVDHEDAFEHHLSRSLRSLFDQATFSKVLCPAESQRHRTLTFSGTTRRFGWEAACRAPSPGRLLRARTGGSMGSSPRRGPWRWAFSWIRCITTQWVVRSWSPSCGGRPSTPRSAGPTPDSDRCLDGRRQRDDHGRHPLADRNERWSRAPQPRRLAPPRAGPCGEHHRGQLRTAPRRRRSASWCSSTTCTGARMACGSALATRRAPCCRRERRFARRRPERA